MGGVSKKVGLVIGISWLVIFALAVALLVFYVSDSQAINSLTVAKQAADTQIQTLNKERDDLTKQVADLGKQTQNLQTSLNQAQQDDSSQKTLGANLQNVIQLGDQIHQQFGLFLRYFAQMADSHDSGDPVGFQTAEQNATQTAGQITALFNQRKAALAKLQTGNGV